MYFHQIHSPSRLHPPVCDMSRDWSCSGVSGKSEPPSVAAGLADTSDSASISKGLRGVVKAGLRKDCAGAVLGARALANIEGEACCIGVGGRGFEGVMGARPKAF